MKRPANAEIEELLDLLARMRPETLAELDNAEKELAATRAYFAAKPRQRRDAAATPQTPPSRP
jgi:hypothetical protein